MEVEGTRAAETEEEVVSSSDGCTDRLVYSSWYLWANGSCLLELEVRGRINYSKAFIIKTFISDENGLWLHWSVTIK